MWVYLSQVTLASGRLSLCQPVYQAPDTMSMVLLVEFEAANEFGASSHDAWTAGTASKPKERRDSMSVVEKNERDCNAGRESGGEGT